MNHVISHFWERWRKDYLLLLREMQRYTKKKAGESPSVHDVVIVHDEKQPRQQWLLGKIEQLLPGTDGEVRGAKVKIGRTRGMINRPVNRLYPIEVNVPTNPTVIEKEVKFHLTRPAAV